MFNVIIAYKESTHVEEKEFKSLNEAIAWLMGSALSGGLQQVIEIAIQKEKETTTDVR